MITNFTLQAIGFNGFATEAEIKVMAHEILLNRKFIKEKLQLQKERNEID